MTPNPSEQPRSNLAPIPMTLAIAVLILGAQDPAPVSPERPKAEPVVAQLVEAHNKERAKEGLPPLTLEPRLTEAAHVHARDMAERDLMTHEGADGSTPLQRIVRTGYHYLATGENVANGYRDISAVMQGWMESPPHRKNVMADFTEIGVARVEGKDGKPYWAAEFGKPMPKLDPAEASSELLRRINQERTDAKLSTLTVDSRLAGAAQAVALDLATNKGQSSAPSPFEKLDSKPFRELAMTTSGGQPDAESLVKSLIENPDYRAQILGKYGKIGVGYAIGEDGIPRWSLILGLLAPR